jgi:hypothetical protein
MKRVLTLGLMMCICLSAPAWGQTAGEDYAGLKIKEKQASSAEAGPLLPYPPLPEGPPMIQGELPAYQAQLKESPEEYFTEGESRKKTLEPTSQQKKEVK